MKDEERAKDERYAHDTEPNRSSNSRLRNEAGRLGLAGLSESNLGARRYEDSHVSESGLQPGKVAVEGAHGNFLATYTWPRRENDGVLSS